MRVTWTICIIYLPMLYTCNNITRIIISYHTKKPENYFFNRISNAHYYITLTCVYKYTIIICLIIFTNLSFFYVSDLEN